MIEVFLRVVHYDRMFTAGGGHYYGFLQQGRDEIQITHKLTQAEADQLNEEEFGRYDGPKEDLEAWQCLYKEGGNCGRFDDEVQLIHAAIKCCLPNILLILGDRIVLNPQLILSGPPKIVDKLNDIVSRYEIADAADDKQAIRSLCREWRQIKGTL
jgi:hypothetical protein